MKSEFDCLMYLFMLISKIHLSTSSAPQKICFEKNSVRQEKHFIKPFVVVLNLPVSLWCELWCAQP